VGNGWSTFASALGLRHSAAELLTEIGATGTSILFIDGIDRVRPDLKGIITDLLRTIESDDSLGDWKVLASSRDQGLEAYRAWFPGSFYHGTGIGDVSVNPFSDDEAEALAAEKPHLRRLLFGAPAVKEIARRPFFAAVLARSLDTVSAKFERSQKLHLLAWIDFDLIKGHSKPSNGGSRFIPEGWFGIGSRRLGSGCSEGLTPNMQMVSTSSVNPKGSEGLGASLRATSPA
jgi:hypothetical protein